MAALLAGSLVLSTATAPNSARFALGKDDFLLDGKPIQIISGEMHPARIPAPYWKHRIQMAKAIGCNTIAAYFFWNYYETEEGKFDFKSENRDIARFLKECQNEGMLVMVRPGPYVCAEWELGGLPPYLLRHPDIKLRCLDPRYMKAVEKWVSRFAKIVKPLQVDRGGPVVMLQIENEYGSYGNDRGYLEALRQMWLKYGITVPFFTADGPTQYMLDAGTLPGAAVGLDSGSKEEHWALARKHNPGVPVFSSETYPGWLTHWGEKWAEVSTEDIVEETRFLLENKKSFNYYVIHGGTNFGFTAGANSGGKGYEPDLTSYDYDAPIGEQGNATPKYHALRELIQSHLKHALPAIPKSIPTMELPPIHMEALTSVWDHLPKPDQTPQPRPFEAFAQDYGFRLYRTHLVGRKNGKLIIRDLHDFATVFLDGKLVGTVDRRLGENSLEIPATTSKKPALDILVEGMGRINFAEFMIDRKGITDRVVLSGMTLMNWESFGLPMKSSWVMSLPGGELDPRPGRFFRGTFSVDQPADTFLDMSGYSKGVVWVNGHNLGRYWNIGPQTRLYCPATFLRKGSNEIRVFDNLQLQSAPISGKRTLK